MSWRYTHHKILALAGILAVSAAMTTPARADIVLGLAADYGVLVEPGAHSLQFNNSSVNGNVGLGAGLGNAGAQIASNGFITGRLDFADASGSVSNPGNVSGGVHFNVSQVTTALNTVNSLSTNFGAEPGTGLSITGGGQVVNVASGMLDANGNNVFTVAANGFSNNNGGFTINGAANTFAIININSAASNEALGGPISLTGGITSDHVLFSFTGTGHLSGGTGGATVNGIFLAPNMLVNIDNTTIDGRLLGGQNNADFSIVSGFHLNAPQVAVPEPSSLALALSSMAVLGIAGAWRRRRRTRA